MTPPAPDWDALQRTIAGAVVLPGMDGYEAARKPAIPRFDGIRPEAIVRCETPADVVETITLAKRSGLRAAPRSGGHCFAGRSSSDGIVIDVSPMRSVSVSDGVATVGAGARLGEVYDSLEPLGLTIAAGCGPEVGIAGLTLGGGLGILGRKHGLTSDQLLGARVVLADGRVIDCDEQHDPDLFWALRGAGGGNFGVVTSLVLRTLPAPIATGFHLVWPPVDAAAVIHAWQAWAPAAPDELAASVLVTAAGNADRPPEVNLFGAMLGTEAETGELLDEVVARVGTDPTSSSSEQLTYRETKRRLVELGAEMTGEPGTASSDRPPSDDGHLFSKSEFFRRPLSPDALQALVEGFSRDRVPGESRELDFTPWGGAYDRVRGDATAFVHRDELFLLKHAVVVDPDSSTADEETAREWLNASWELVHPWGAGGVYPNFPDPELRDWARAYWGDNHERLVQIKAHYDPDRFFRFHQSL